MGVHRFCYNHNVTETLLCHSLDGGVQSQTAARLKYAIAIILGESGEDAHDAGLSLYLFELSGVYAARTLRPMPGADYIDADAAQRRAGR